MLVYQGYTYRVAVDVDEQARSDDYAVEQPYLYHVTLRKHLPDILKYGLQPGSGENFPGAIEHARDRVFLSTQPDKWWSSISGDKVLLRVPTDQVRCFYDGGEWLYDGDEDEIIDGRLADCWSADPIPPELIEVVGT